MIIPLNDFEEQSGSILQGLGEDLQQVSLFVIVDQYLVLFQQLHIFQDFDIHVRQVLSQQVVVRTRNVQELDPTILHVLHCLDDLVRLESQMLNTSIVIIIHVLLDLRFTLPCCRLVDRHLHVLVVVRYHY